MITTIHSTRVYYKDLLNDDVSMIHHDILLYHSIRNHAYNMFYNNFHDIADDSVSSTELKRIYQVNDYIPLSAVSEAKGIFRSNVTWNRKTIEDMLSRSKKIEKKIAKEKKKLDKCLVCLDSLISYSRTGIPAIKKIRNMKWKKKTPDICTYHDETMNLYLFEVTVLKPYIKRLRNRIKQLNERAKRLRFRISKRMEVMPRARFKINNYMKITGRAQGRYCNNLFKYDCTNRIMTYIASDHRRISFPLVFPHKEYELIRVLKMGHSMPGKAVCYTLTDHGEYFIISASITLPDKDILFDSGKGAIGMDINASHVALAETDGYGNMIWCDEIRYDLKKKTREQRRAILQKVVIQIIQKCREKNKPLVKEELDFKKAKREMEMYDSNKKFNKMLSEFSYRTIDEKIESRAYKENIAVRRVDPAYTSRIGDLKYRRAKGISVHKSAAYVIARRGMEYREKVYGY